MSANDAIKIAQISGLAPTLKEQKELKENLNEVDQIAFSDWLMKIQGKEKSLPNIEHLLDFLTDNVRLT